MQRLSFSTSGLLLLERYGALSDKRVRNVYCDMDGVLADFIGGMERLYNLSGSAAVEKFLSKPHAWEQVHEEHPDIFAQLTALPDAAALMRVLKQLEREKRINLFILTAVPNELLHSRAILDKKDWMYRHFQIDPRKVFVGTRKDKSKYALIDKMEGRQPSILIDDFKKNIREWEQLGSGEGIQHITTARTLPQLRTLLDESA